MLEVKWRVFSVSLFFLRKAFQNFLAGARHGDLIVVDERVLGELISDRMNQFRAVECQRVPSFFKSFLMSQGIKILRAVSMLKDK